MGQEQKKSLRDLLERFRSHARSPREQGTYFERLCVDFLKNDSVHGGELEDVWTYAEWARSRGESEQDTGIDLVASIRGKDSFCAIQCKFYSSSHRIQKHDVASFMAASEPAIFTRRLFIDTTDGAWSKHAENLLRSDLTAPVTRITLSDMDASSIDWNVYSREQKVVHKKKKTLHPHQKEALKGVREGLLQADRGKLIMACGTGKTFTSLRIAEDIAGEGGQVLFLVPSLSLMSQTIREWTNDANVRLRSFAVCSDVQVGRHKGNDVGDLEVHDLLLPATTHAEVLACNVGESIADCMTVIFSTYHSIQVISDAQHRHSLGTFDLIICDEAHRTTGVTLAEEDESHFVKVHSDEVVAARKRLYMTATPKIFGDTVKSKAKDADAVLASMDNADVFGKTLFTFGFSQAVEKNLLTDYKVIVLAVDEKMVSEGVERRLMDGDSQLKLDDATKIIGCYKALMKSGLTEGVSFDPGPMQTALAFCKDIRTSKLIREEFADVVDEYRERMTGEEESLDLVTCEVEHVDGTDNAKTREHLLRWLRNGERERERERERGGGGTCRILSNARCLSEGVDVPSLDAILFLHPRKSVIDVVQSVGRVMRTAPGKKRGYVILPVGIPQGKTAAQVLSDNAPYRVVWQILNALRSHDDRFDSTINRVEFGEDVRSRIEVVAIRHDMPSRGLLPATRPNIGQGSGEEQGLRQTPSAPGDLFVDDFAKGILARIVKKCGTRTYWEDWAADVGRIAQTHITRITAVVDQEGSAREAFDSFLEEIRDDINDSVSRGEAIEMLAQHIITRPVFDALFPTYRFSDHNSVSVAMQAVLEVLEPQNLQKETESLGAFYASVRRRVQGIETDTARQRIIKDLYDQFFQTAFPLLSDRMGIVHTPIEVADFIIRSVNDVLKAAFGQTLSSEGVHILDPFTGTGTFITRLLQSGLIAPEDLEHKFRNEIHANEMVLLAYYIAAVNVEVVYHEIRGGGGYESFRRICLTDTFQLNEREDLLSDYLPENSRQRKQQQQLPIRVIIGNPPYSRGQRSANDNAANVKYQALDKRVRDTYARHSTATSKYTLYDSYIRAFRWASDRIGEEGVIGFVTNAGWIDGIAMDGLRKCLVEEFSDIYIFHLRGNARTSGELRRKEKDNVFGSGSRAPIAISVLVKKKDASGHIHFYDIGDYHNREEKLKIIKEFGSTTGITRAGKWQKILPNQNHDWINQRNPSFDTYPVLGDKKNKNALCIFEDYSLGLGTNRDAWCYNFSKETLADNMRRTIGFYNAEVERYQASAIHPNTKIADFINNDPTKISWDRPEKKGVAKGIIKTFKPECCQPSMYRPFMKNWAYFGRDFNNCVYKMPRIFPDADAENRAIGITGKGAGAEFSCLMVDTLPDIQNMYNGQWFPLRLYKPNTTGGSDLYTDDSTTVNYQVRDGITGSSLRYFQNAYTDESITKEDLFYYIYGLLHAPEYRERFRNNLSKQLPRIPAVKSVTDFWAFSNAGRTLGDLHVTYESADLHPVIIKEDSLHMGDPQALYRVTKMKFAGKRSQPDKSTVIYNSNITLQDIPLEAYDYVVNGKSALKWVMERQCIKTDKKSEIRNDANRYANETARNPAYPLELFQRMITVSLKTMEIVRGLPSLELPD